MCAPVGKDDSSLTIYRFVDSRRNPPPRMPSKTVFCSSFGRWVDQSTALLAAPAPSPASYLDASPYSQSTGGGGGGGGSGGTCGPSPAYSNASGHLWENNVYGWGNSLASPVHSPGWPSPRATEGGLMQLPLPPTPTSYFAAGAATRGAAFPAMPPSPPSTSSNVRGDAVGVAWLAETKATKTAKETTGVGEGTAGAAGAAGAAVAGGARNSAVADEGEVLCRASRRC